MIIEDFMHYIYIYKECDEKFEILKYPINRFFGKDVKFDKPVTLRNKLGTWYCDIIMENCLVSSSSFEPEILKELIKIKKGVFVDVGAHIGKYSIIMGKNLRNNGYVVSIEADKRNVSLLKINAKLNNVHNIKIYNFVCLDKKRKVNFYISSTNPATNSYIERNNKKEVKLKSNTIDNLGLKNVGCIKMDIEGSESLALKGALKTIKKYKPVIIFEAKNKQGLDKIWKIIKEHYKIEKLCNNNYIAKAI